MFYEEDLDIFLADFGQTATIISGGQVITLQVIFENDYVPVNLGGAEVESYGPAATCKTSAIDGIAHADTIEINSVTYTIRGIQPDDSGITVLMLKRN